MMSRLLVACLLVAGCAGPPATTPDIVQRAMDVLAEVGLPGQFDVARALPSPVGTKVLRREVQYDGTVQLLSWIDSNRFIYWTYLAYPTPFDYANDEFEVIVHAESAPPFGRVGYSLLQVDSNGGWSVVGASSHWAALNGKPQSPALRTVVESWLRSAGVDK
jgi:hypothetical protein